MMKWVLGLAVLWCLVTNLFQFGITIVHGPCCSGHPQWSQTLRRYGLLSTRASFCVLLIAAVASYASMEKDRKQ